MFLKKRFLVLLQLLDCKINSHTAVFVRRVVTSAVLLKNNGFKDCRRILEEFGYGYGNKLLYNSRIEQIKSDFGYKSDFLHQVKKKSYKKRIENVLETIEPLPLSLKYYCEDMPIPDVNHNNEVVSTEKNKLGFQQSKYTNFPLSITHLYKEDTNFTVMKQNVSENYSSIVDKEIQLKYELLKKNKNWMTAYENFEYDLEETEQNDILMENWTVNYGTPDPNCKISCVPCGGCGALLHCKVITSVFCNYHL